MSSHSNNIFEISDSVKPYFAGVVFLISLIFICFSGNERLKKLMPIGRAGSAIVGSTLMVFFGIVPSNEIGSVVNWDTIILLMSMMMLSNYMEKANIWQLASKALLYKCNSPFTFLIRVCLISASMSAILTNDTVCVTFTPIVLKACSTSNLPYFPFLMAIATSANIGSSALPVGNPQNMIIATAGGLNFFNFFRVSIVSSILGTITNTALLYFYFKSDLKKYNNNFNQLIETTDINIENGDKEMENVNLDKEEVHEEGNNEVNEEEEEGIKEIKHDGDGHGGSDNIILKILKLLNRFKVGIILTLILIGFFIGLHMGFTVLFGVSILMVLERKDIKEIIDSVDWELLIFFSGLFILVDGFDRQFSIEAWSILKPFVPIDTNNINIFKIFIFSLLVLVLCNILGNVPLVLSLCPRLLDSNSPTFTWLLLAFVSTVAGNLTLVGSVANLIVAEKSKSYHTIGFIEYLKFGVPSTIIVILIGVPIVVLIGIK